MKERPILMSAPMVLALLEGRKTQTRRVVRGSTEFNRPYNPAYLEAHRSSLGWAKICPYGQLGDTLLVVELRNIPQIDPRLYQAGSDGRIYSHSVARTNSKKDKPFVLSIVLASTGYPVVSIIEKSRKRSIASHILICSAFHGEKPSATSEVRHLDGNRANSNPDNLCWGTPSENEADKRRHGTAAIGEKHGAAKLTQNVIRIIRDTVPIGLLTPERVAQFYGVDQSTIRRIARGENWNLSSTSDLPSPSYIHIRLEISDISVQRLQEISEEDVQAEGCELLESNCDGECGATPCRITRSRFVDLWESINGPSSWAVNPWVWALTFKVVQP